MPDVWGLASIPAKFLTYLGVLWSTGLVLTLLVFGRETAGMHRRLFRLAILLAVLGLLATALGFVFKGAALTGEASGMVDREMLGLLWLTPAGTALLLRVTGLAVLLAGLLVPGFGRWVAGAGGILALWSFSRIGHVPEAGSFWLQILLLLHLSVAAFWIGILAPLRALAGETGSLSRAASLGRSFGQIAAFLVPGLILAGIVMAWRLLGDFSALVGSGYGLTLLAKVACVLVLLGAAAFNKFRFVPGMMSGDPAAAIRLRQSIAFEWAAVLVILFLTAGLTSVLGPPSYDMH